jgi:SagB-type dehydrogenase family enzyme
MKMNNIRHAMISILTCTEDVKMMTFKSMMIGISLTTLAFTAIADEGTLTDIPLPTPHMQGGKPLMQVLKDRQSSRAFSTKKLTMQTLSDLLWAAFGINRPDSEKRTAPSTRNWQEIDVYAVMEDGAYLYDAKTNTLKLVVKGDIRKMTGAQPFVASAPLNLVYVADVMKMKNASPNDITLYSGADVGFISQNVYLFCASEGLATVVRGLVDRDVCAKALNLSGQKKIILAQTVGYP